MTVEMIRTEQERERLTPREGRCTAHHREKAGIPRPLDRGRCRVDRPDPGLHVRKLAGKGGGESSRPNPQDGLAYGTPGSRDRAEVLVACGIADRQAPVCSGGVKQAGQASR